MDYQTVRLIVIGVVILATAFVSAVIICGVKMGCWADKLDAELLANEEAK